MRTSLSGVMLVAWLLAIPCLSFADSGPPIIAVFNVETKGVSLAPGVLENLSDYVATRLTESGKYQVVPRDQLKERLIEQKKASYSACFDQSCQIELGREMAAQKTLATRVAKLGNECKVSLNVFDLAKATSEAAATGSGSCTETGIVWALDVAIGKLTGVTMPAVTAEPTRGKELRPPPDVSSSGSPGNTVPPPAVETTAPVVRKGTVKAVTGDVTVTAKTKDGTQVRLDLVDPSGKAIASGSPFKDDQAKVGTWRATARAAKHQDETMTFQVPPDEPVLIKLDLKRLGDLTVIAKTTAGAAVRMDVVDPTGKATASGSPLRDDQARPGTWKITAQATGHEEVTRVIEVRLDAATTESIELKPLGGLKVTGEPLGAAVKVTGPGGFKDEGGLPWEAEGLRSGTYSIEVSRAGYESFTREVRVEAGTVVPMPIKLSKAAGDHRLDDRHPSLRDGWLGTLAALEYLTFVLAMPGAGDRAGNPTAWPSGWSPTWDSRRLWLTRFVERNGTVSISGEALDHEDVGEFYRRLAGSGLFQDLVPGRQNRKVHAVLGIRYVEFNMEATLDCRLAGALLAPANYAPGTVSGEMVLPREEGLPDLIESLKSDLDSAGLAMSLLSPKPRTKQRGYSELGLSLQVAGDFRQFTAFLIALLSPDKRLVTISNLSLQVAASADVSGVSPDIGMLRILREREQVRGLTPNERYAKSVLLFNENENRRLVQASFVATAYVRGEGVDADKVLANFQAGARVRDADSVEHHPAMQSFLAAFFMSPRDERRNVFRSNLAMFAPTVEIEGELVTTPAPKSPLQAYDVDSYRLVRIMSGGTAQAKALVVAPSDKSYIVQAGTRIGNRGGRVASITSTQVRVEEPGRPAILLVLKPPPSSMEENLRAIQEF